MKKMFFTLVGVALLTSCTQQAVAGKKLSKSERIAEGKTIFDNSCGKCHDLPDPKSHTDTEWIGIVNAMAPKAKLTNEQGELVYDYVTSQN